MNELNAQSTWRIPVMAGAVLVVVFVALVVASATVRHYWVLLALAAIAAALPFLVREPAMPDQPTDKSTVPRALPLLTTDAATESQQPIPALRASAVTVAKAAAVATAAEEGGDPDNEDAYEIDTDSGYVAVADGASSSFRAGEWARHLCTTFVAERPLSTTLSQDWIDRASAAFSDGTAAGDDAMATQWWSAGAAERGAHAAFAGLAVARRDQHISWRATAIGDCVLVHLRADDQGRPPIVTAFPVSHSAAFPANPRYCPALRKAIRRSRSSKVQPRSGTFGYS